MAKRKATDDEQVTESEGAATPPPPEAAKPYEGGEHKRHPDTGEPQGVDDPPGDPARTGQPGDLDAEGKPIEAKGEGARAKAAKKLSRRVSVRGHPELTVEFDEPERVSGQGKDDREKAVKDAAVKEYQRRRGIWSLPAEPTVEE